MKWKLGLGCGSWGFGFRVQGRPSITNLLPNFASRTGGTNPQGGPARPVQKARDAGFVRFDDGWQQWDSQKTRP